MDMGAGRKWRKRISNAVTRDLLFQVVALWSISVLICHWNQHFSVVHTTNCSCYNTDFTSGMTAPVPKDLGRALCIITGASKGFGRALAIQIYSLLKPNSVILLVARSKDKLNELRADLATSETDRAGLAIRFVVADLREKEGIEETVRAARETPSADIEHLLLINNAGEFHQYHLFLLFIFWYIVNFCSIESELVAIL